MSIDANRIVCSGCDYNRLETYRPLVLRYRTASGCEFESHQAKGWCYQCDSYSSVEALHHDYLAEKLAALDAEQHQLLQQITALQQGWLKRLRHCGRISLLRSKQLQLHQQRAAYRIHAHYLQQRRSHSRCLSCGSDRTVALRYSAQSNSYHTPAGEFRHHCGSTLSDIPEPSGLRFHYRLVTLVLDQEGLLLEERLDDRR